LDTVSTTSTLCEFYRFAFLLAGDASRAERALAKACKDVEAELGQLRNELQRRGWLAMRIREYCRQYPPIETAIPVESNGNGEVPLSSEDEAHLLAKRFSTVQEPDRTALALFYLKLFSVEEIAGLLEMNLDGVANSIGRGRKVLQHAEAIRSRPVS